MIDIQGGVTRARYFALKFSASRNARSAYRSTPDACHWCRERFKSEQMRYPVMTAVEHSGGWGIASVCMKCFKDGHDCESTLRDSISRLDRVNTQCAGCGEPIQTITNARAGCWYVCSNRCYQRAYRKRRRGRQSVVEWKAENRAARCEACKRPIERSRCDARFCSNRCRQGHYRRRKRAGGMP
jgi:hypothetical protein